MHDILTHINVQFIVISNIYAVPGLHKCCK